MNILITNDDSHRSPLLQIAVDYFSRIGTVHLVVPLHEQSWTGKSISRFNPVHVQRETLCGVQGWSVAGTPADCVNLGVHNLLPVKPDLVVSGINAGFNIGVGFLLSSGTVGAGIEGNLAGIPSLALSQAFDSEARNVYTADYLIAPEHVSRFREQTGRMLDRLLAIAFSPEHKEAFLATPVTWNVNFPFRLRTVDSFKYAHLGNTRYGKIFDEQAGGLEGDVRVFKHGKVEEVRDTDSECDSAQLKNGAATVSLIDVWGVGTHEIPTPISGIIGQLSS